MTRPPSRFSTLAMCTGVAVVLASPVRPAWARAPAPPRPGGEAREAEASASVLELDGPDRELAARVSEALRQELAQRGIGGGRAATTAEVRIALECESLDEPCLGRAARLLGARRVILGALEAEPPALKLQVFVRDPGRIDQSIELPLRPDDLEDDRLSGLAVRAADLLFPDTTAELPLEAIDPETPSPASEPEPEPRIDGTPGKLKWGPYSPRPRWKWAAFGTSAALLGVGLVGFFVTVIPVARSGRRRGFLYESIEDAAMESLTNTSTIDDVDPATVLDMCSDAEGSGGALEVLDEDDGVAMPGVRNVTVGRECQRAERWARWATRSTIFSAVMAVSTVAFTTLLFVRRVPPRKRLSFGLAPDLQGGAHVVGSVRF